MKNFESSKEKKMVPQIFSYIFHYPIKFIQIKIPKIPLIKITLNNKT